MKKELKGENKKVSSNDFLIKLMSDETFCEMLKGAVVKVDVSLAKQKVWDRIQNEDG